MKFIFVLLFAAAIVATIGSLMIRTGVLAVLW